VLTLGDGRRTSGKRAVGTREHVIAYLTEHTELFDPGGMASTRLAGAVSYPGSSVAFAQLLSGMERSGLIEREVRGKRTYRIRLGPAEVAGPSAGHPAGHPADQVARAGGASGVRGLAGMLGPDPGASAGGFDYDELARRLLAQVVRRLAGTGPTRAGAVPVTGLDTPDLAVLRETVAALEYELADAWAKHGRLAEENVRLREQLGAAEQSLALARESLRRLPVTAGLDQDEVELLQQLLAGDTAGWAAARPLRAERC
jgi:hypothetical protein